MSQVFKTHEPAVALGNVGNECEASPEATKAVASSAVSASTATLLEQAMESIPSEDKAAYLEALEKAPHLIESESNPEIYLRFDDSKPKAAAKRLALYWKERQRAFKERAFRPLEFSPQGAFFEKDYPLLGTQHLKALPSTQQGYGVLYLNRPRLNRIIPNHKDLRDTKIRNSFYALHCLAQSESTRQNGFIMLATCNTDIAQAGQFDRQVVQTFAQMATTAFPLKLNEFHFVCSPPKPARRAFAETIVPVALKRLQQVFQPFTRVVAMHVGSPQKLFSELKETGLSQKGVPPCLGGTWEYPPSPVLEAVTDDRKPPPLKKDVLQQDAKSNEQQAKIISLESSVVSEKEEEEKKKPAAASPHLDQLAEAAARTLEQKEIRKREMGVVYSRRKRRRQKERFESLKTLATTLQGQNMALKDEMQFLQATLTAAQINIAVYEQQRSAQISSLLVSAPNLASQQQQALAMLAPIAVQQQPQVLAGVDPSLLLSGLTTSQGTPSNLAMPAALLGATSVLPSQETLQQALPRGLSEGTVLPSLTGQNASMLASSSSSSPQGTLPVSNTATGENSNNNAILQRLIQLRESELAALNGRKFHV